MKSRMKSPFLTTAALLAINFTLGACDKPLNKPVPIVAVAAPAPTDAAPLSRAVEKAGAPPAPDGVVAPPKPGETVPTVPQTR